MTKYCIYYKETPRGRLYRLRYKRFGIWTWFRSDGGFVFETPFLHKAVTIREGMIAHVLYKQSLKQAKWRQLEEN